MLIAGVLLVLLLRFWFTRDEQPGVVAATTSVPAAEKRLVRLRQAASSVHGKEQLLERAAAELGAREKGMIVADTAAQAQAQVLETLRRVGKTSGIDVRGAEELKIRPLADDYGEVLVAVAFNCRIDQLVNFLADLANETQLLATNEMRIASANAKDKSIAVRLGVSGVVSRKLVPAKKGPVSF